MANVKSMSCDDEDHDVCCSALLVLLQDSLITTAGSPMFSELVMKVKKTCCSCLRENEPYSNPLCV